MEDWLKCPINSLVKYRQNQKKQKQKQNQFYFYFFNKELSQNISIKCSWGCTSQRIRSKSCCECIHTWGSVLSGTPKDELKLIAMSLKIVLA